MSPREEYDNNQLFSIKLMGEQHTYELRGSEQHNMKAMAELIADLSGYRPEYLASKYLSRIKIGKSVTLGHDLGLGLGSIKLLVKRVA